MISKNYGRENLGKWDELGQVETSWDKLGQVGMSWDELGRVGTSWDELGRFGTSWEPKKLQNFDIKKTSWERRKKERRRI